MPATIKIENMLTSRDAANELGIHIVTLHRLVAEGKIRRAKKIANAWLFDADEVERFKKIYDRTTGKIIK